MQQQHSSPRLPVASKALISPDRSALVLADLRAVTKFTALGAALLACRIRPEAGNEIDNTHSSKTSMAFMLPNFTGWLTAGLGIGLPSRQLSVDALRRSLTRSTSSSCDLGPRQVFFDILARRFWAIIRQVQSGVRQRRSLVPGANAGSNLERLFRRFVPFPPPTTLGADARLSNEQTPACDGLDVACMCWFGAHFAVFLHARRPRYQNEHPPSWHRPPFHPLAKGADRYAAMPCLHPGNPQHPLHQSQIQK